VKISVDKIGLLNVLSKTQNIVEKRNTMPVLANVLLEAKEGSLKVFATDLEVSLTDQIFADIEQPGVVAVNAKIFFEVIRELKDGQVRLTKTQNNRLTIEQGRDLINIVGISSEEFPIFPTQICFSWEFYIA